MPYMIGRAECSASDYERVLSDYADEDAHPDLRAMVREAMADNYLSENEYEAMRDREAEIQLEEIKEKFKE